MEDVEGGAVAVGDEKASRTEALGGMRKKQAETLVLKGSEMYARNGGVGHGDTPGPHLADCSSPQLSRSGCGCCGDLCPGPSVEGGSVSDPRGSRTRSRGTGTPSVPSPWGRAGP